MRRNKLVGTLAVIAAAAMIPATAVATPDPVIDLDPEIELPGGPIAVPVEFCNEQVVTILGTDDPEAVSYTHLTLPTN